ncbi:mitochondrial carrier domain-containing protein [Cladochytrium replicatum]|nr:mitochondrial carrier domain-containing protein [Cladochytrium replicatum]
MSATVSQSSQQRQSVAAAAAASSASSSSTAQTAPFHLHHHSLNPSQRLFTNFVAGATALSAAFAVMHPLDTWKTNRQMASTSASASKASLASTFRLLTKGFFTSVIGSAPQGGIRLMTYEYTKSKLSSPQTNATSLHLGNLAASALSAVIGDTASSIIKVPREVITSKLQTASHFAHAQPATFVNVSANIWRTEGFQGFFRGFWITTLRDWPFMCILFTTYESFKLAHLRSFSPIAKNPQDAAAIPTGPSILFGGISGGLAGWLTAPFDLVRTRVMTTGAGVREVVLSVREGPNPIRTAFTGAGARSLWWFCVCSMFFPMYERTKEFVRDRIDPEGAIPLPPVRDQYRI